MRRDILHTGRALRHLLVSAAVLAAIGGLVLAARPSPAGGAVTGTKVHSLPRHGSWSSGCFFARRAPDDPIVYPGQPGRSHSHDFFGNPSTDAFSTLASLLSTPGKCNVSVDRSAYWIPTLLKHNQDGTTTPIPSPTIKLYYRAAQRDPQTIQPFPRGLRIIAGDSQSTGAQEQVEFWCTATITPTEPSQFEPPACDPGEYLAVRIVFPDCSDGRTDSADHKSHMAYAVRLAVDQPRTCPSSHPIAVPQLSLLAVYSGTAGEQVEFASGGMTSFHADFFEAWTTGSIQQLIDECLKQDLICERPNVT